jgi:DNA-binding protein HU-beta
MDARARLHKSRKEIVPMAKAATANKTLTKSEIATQIAEKTGLSRKQVNQVFEAQSELAYKQAKNTFQIPGIGKLVLSERPPREMVMRFGPKTGQTVKIPKKKVLKFRVSKAAKDAILGPKR